jgi:hypothetical protein
LGFQIGGGIAGDSNLWFQCLQDMEMPTFHFGAISVKFQIQLPVTVRILELYRMKKLLGVN